VPAWVPASSWPIERKRVAVTGGWVVAFAVMSATGGFGDHHPGQYLPFWVQACSETGRDRACAHVAQMEQTYCDRGSGWACNELGILRATREEDLAAARGEFERSCSLGFTPGCDNVLRTTVGTVAFASGPPPDAELPIVLRGSKGAIRERDPEALYALGCERGWNDLCTGPRKSVEAAGPRP